VTALADIVMPALSRIPNVELIHVGTWPAGGEGIGPEGWTASTEDLAAAVAALDCPSIRRPVIKLGHVPDTPGQPAIGWVDNLGLVDGGVTLVGDLVGMPGWLAPILASAYPSRSIEGFYDLRCQIGHTHPFVVTAVALLGVEQPAVGTLADLHDSPLAQLAALYGVDIVDVAAGSVDVDGTPVTTTVSGGSVPNPRPRAVTATATADDVRRAYYDTAPWSHWITEVQLDPLQLIVEDDDTSRRYRVPVAIDPALEGVDAVSFGTPVEVVVRYEDAASVAAARAGRPGPIRYASRAESRPSTPASPTAAQTGGTDVQLTADQMTALRQRLALPDDADEAAILAALAAPVATADPADEPADADSDAEDQVDADAQAAADADADPAAEDPTTVTLDADAYQELVSAARAGSQSVVDQAAAERTRLVDAAVTDGRIPPARRGAWLQLLEADPAATATLASLQPGVVPLRELGHASPQASTTEGDAPSPYDALYRPATPTRKV
jgi:hypothetical protein